jgi:NAD(P)-dependent dehydrogenase (short-subunit alcohol dehydrogenase family)/acyl carrier protein
VSGGAVSAVLVAVLDLVQQWLADERFAAARLVVVTRAAVAVGGGEVPDAVRAAVWGLVRSAQAEHPGRFVLVDTDDPDAAPWQRVLGSGHEQLALRGGEVFVPRLARVSGDGDGGGDGGVGAGAVLVTGGTGGLGAVVARHLVTRHGVRELVLASRGGPAAKGAEQLVAELTESGCTARVVACDVADRAAVAELLASIPRLSAVVHTAGVLDDAMVASLSVEQVERVLAAKVGGALVLDELTRDRDLSAFVLFSSLAGVIGSPGQGNYAAASAFLDALARRRRVEGLAATSIAWGPWSAEAGMTARLDPTHLTRWERLGVRPLRHDLGLALFDAALNSHEPAPVAADLDRATLRAHPALPAVLRGLVPATTRSGAPPTRLTQLSETEMITAVLDLIRTHVATATGQRPGQIDPEVSFDDFGLDSLAAVELRNTLSKATGLQLPATLVFDQPSPAAVVQYVRTRLVRAVPQASASSDAELDDALARVEALLAAIPDTGKSKWVEQRISAFQSRAQVLLPTHADESDDLDAATDEEMFGMIDKEFGIS